MCNVSHYVQMQEDIDPVHEVFLYEQRQKIERNINVRQTNILSSIGGTYLYNPAAQPAAVVPPEPQPAAQPALNAIDLVSDDSEDTMDYPDITTQSRIPTTRAVTPMTRPVTTPESAVHHTKETQAVSKTLVLLFERIINHDSHMNDCLPECSRPCPYFTGPLMGQRYHLAKRLLQLEQMLYGV